MHTLTIIILIAYTDEKKKDAYNHNFARYRSRDSFFYFNSFDPGKL